LKNMNRIHSISHRLASATRSRLESYTGRSITGRLGRMAVAIGATTLIVLLVDTRSAFKISAHEEDVRNFTVDVAFRDPYYQNNVNPAQDPTTFSKGDTFIQDGTVFPAWTIPNGKTDFDPNMPGAIGTYRARGTWTTDLDGYLAAVAKDDSKPLDSAMAFATELFSFGQAGRTVLTDGAMPNANFSAARTVLGGTGSFRDVIGEVHEENIGENKLGFCNLRVTFRIRRVSEDRWR
jgi:hypothetical protein